MTMDVARTAAAARADGGRRGALVDLAVWFVLVAAAVAAATGLSTQMRLSGAMAQVIVVVQMAALFAVTTVLLRRRGESWRSVGLARPRSIVMVVVLVIGGYASLAVLNAVVMLKVIPALHLSLPRIGILKGLTGDPVSYALWLALAWTSAAIGEELQFRGFLRSRLERLLGGGKLAVAGALVGQAAVFGLGHVYQGLGGVIVTAAAGLVLGAVFLAGRRNLVACMALHGLIDTVSITAMFLGAIPASMTG